MITNLFCTWSGMMELIKKDSAKILANPGCESMQYISPENSASQRLTVTRVRVQAGATNGRHYHKVSEQVWVVLSGQGELLLADERTLTVEAGDAVRFADSEVHGLQNTSQEVFEYLSITAPPINFRPVYQSVKENKK